MELGSRSCFLGYITKTKNVLKDIGSEYCLFVVRLYIFSAGYAELPVVLLYLCLMYHMLSKTRSSGSLHRVIGEVSVLGLLVVVYKIPYSSCRFNTANGLEPGKM